MDTYLDFYGLSQDSQRSLSVLWKKCLKNISNILRLQTEKYYYKCEHLKMQNILLDFLKSYLIMLNEDKPKLGM